MVATEFLGGCSVSSLSPKLLFHELSFYFPCYSNFLWFWPLNVGKDHHETSDGTLSHASLNCWFKGPSSSLSWLIIATGHQVLHTEPFFWSEAGCLEFSVSVSPPIWIKDCFHILLKWKPLQIDSLVCLVLCFGSATSIACWLCATLWSGRSHHVLYVLHPLALSPISSSH